MPRLKCPACFRPPAYCYCSRLYHVVNATPVFILQDVREAKHPIGTARIAALSLSQVEMAVLDPDRPDTGMDLLANIFSRPLRNPALIYPGQLARPISDLSGANAVMAERRDLLFIDASWGRSLRMMKVFPALAALPLFALADMPVSRYRIRRQPANDAVSTLEAIVHTLQQLEPASDFTPMLATMDWVIEQQIQRMGGDVYRNNYKSGHQ